MAGTLYMRIIPLSASCFVQCAILTAETELNSFLFHKFEEEKWMVWSYTDSSYSYYIFLLVWSRRFQFSVIITMFLKQAVQPLHVDHWSTETICQINPPPPPPPLYALDSICKWTLTCQSGSHLTSLYSCCQFAQCSPPIMLRPSLISSLSVSIRVWSQWISMV